MPKIFVLRHQLAEQQAKLRQHDKQGENASSPPLSSDEEAAKEALINEQSPNSSQPSSPPASENRPEILSRPPPGLVIQPIPPPIQPNLAGKKITLCLTYLSQACTTLCLKNYDKNSYFCRF